MVNKNKPKRKSNRIIVTSQTMYHLHQMSDLYGLSSIGRVVDKLVREKQLQLENSVDILKGVK